MTEATEKLVIQIDQQLLNTVKTAEDYYYAGKLCLEEFKKTNDFHYIFPAFINYALSGELYLKAIYYYEKDKDFGKVHSYDVIIKKLSSQAREQIEQLYQCNCKKECYSDAIIRYGNIYVNWRYRNELTEAHSNVYDFIALIDAIKTTCEQKEAQIIAEMTKSEGTI